MQSIVAVLCIFFT